MEDGGLLDYWEQWMRATAGASERTVETRLGGIEALCHHAGTDDPVSLTTRQIVAWLADQRAAWTRRTYAMTARQWHRWLVDQGFREDDPTAKLPLPPQPRGVPRPASSEALDAVLTDATRRLLAYIELAAFEGLRVHEIAKLRGEDFDDDGDWLYVRGKGGREWALPVHGRVQMLRRGFPARGWWFPSRRRPEGHVSPNSVTQAVSRAFRRHGYDVTAHQLRHWFGTHALRTSKDLRVTQELMRHQSSSSTQIYTEVADLAKQETVRRLQPGNGIHHRD